MQADFCCLFVFLIYSNKFWSFIRPLCLRKLVPASTAMQQEIWLVWLVFVFRIRDAFCKVKGIMSLFKVICEPLINKIDYRASTAPHVGSEPPPPIRKGGGRLNRKPIPNRNFKRLPARAYYQCALVKCVYLVTDVDAIWLLNGTIPTGIF